MAGVRLHLTPNPRDLAKLLRVFAAMRRVGASPRRALGRTALFLIREARRLLRARIREWGPQTGKLGKSLTMLLDSMSVIVGSNLPYAAIQHFGGTIKPKGHPYLAIPALAHLRRSGVWPRDLDADSMMFMPNAKIRIGSHSWTGPALVRVEDEFRTGKNGKQRRVRKAGEVMFALIERATIRGRPYLIFGPPGREFLYGELRRDYIRALRAA